MPDFLDVHKDEAIVGSCPYCRLPIYESDPKRMVSDPKGGRPRPFHQGCALTQRGHELESELTLLLKELRGLGYTVDLKIVRPVT